MTSTRSRTKTGRRRKKSQEVSQRSRSNNQSVTAGGKTLKTNKKKIEGNLIGKFTEVIQKEPQESYKSSGKKLKKFESKLGRILEELSERYVKQDYQNIEGLLSELMCVVISIQEADLDPVVLLQSDLGRYFEGVWCLYNKLKHIPLNVRENRSYNLEL